MHGSIAERNIRPDSVRISMPLPIEEKNEIDFKSVNTGVMHACGHDMHASVAAGLP